MTLTDAGALVALLDADAPYHAACVAAAQRLPAGPLLTTCTPEELMEVA
jgi:hypothetical protein